MLSYEKPYLIIPYLVEQPTWGGDYIVKFKNWENLEYLKNKKIGQSYELYGKSKLATSITDSNDKGFAPDSSFEEFKNSQYIILSDLVNDNPVAVLGKEVFEKFGKMPLLIKFTQALGNSFQLHIRPNEKDSKWKPKAESWFYFEKGFITFGIKKGIILEEFKNTCKLIEEKMISLSQLIKINKITQKEAQKEAKEFINRLNPWQFVNRHEVEPYSLIDLSPGGLQHSWEEDKERFPLGNVLYEIQQDVPDDSSTIRSFDQGKIKENGDIRKLNIEDYFKYLDVDEKNNDIKNGLIQKKGNRLLTTKNYCLDIIEVESEVLEKTENSFIHLFVSEGDVNISTEESMIRVGKGHSCFIPKALEEYKVKSIAEKSIILKTFIVIE